MKWISTDQGTVECLVDEVSHKVLGKVRCNSSYVFGQSNESSFWEAYGVWLTHLGEYMGLAAAKRAVEQDVKPTKHPVSNRSV